MTQSSPVDAGIPNSHVLVASLVPSGSRVLDIGCGFGAIARQLADRDCQVTGIEPDPERRATAAPACVRVMDGLAEDLEALDLDPAGYDAVLFADVLEHLKDPWTTLATATKFLAPRGRIVISIPNVANFGARVNLLKGEFTYQGGGLYDRTHLRFFTQATVDDLVRGAGLEPIQREYTCNLSETGPFRKLARLLPPLGRPLRRLDRSLTYRNPRLYALQFILACKLAGK
jgi:2-polyprenyl-3-methyl-5-hydroxy-6-metoxy-1,4-benzoquinol methylase